MCAQDNAQKIPYRSSTVVCIRVQWNHPALSGCAPGGRGWIWSFWGIRGWGLSPFDMQGYDTDRSTTQRA